MLLADPGYPCTRHFVRTSKARRSASRSGRDELPAHGRAIERALDAAHARRAHRLAVQPHRHHGAGGGDGAHRGDGRAPRRHARSSTRSTWAHLRRAPAQRACGSPTTLRDLELLQVLQHDRVAAGMDRRARAHVRDLEKLAQNLYISPPRRRSARRSRASRRRRLRSSRRGAASSRSAATTWCRRCASSGSACRSCPTAASSSMPIRARFAPDSSASAATCSRLPAWRSRPASISAAIARRPRALLLHDRQARLEEGVARLPRGSALGDRADRIAAGTVQLPCDALARCSRRVAARGCSAVDAVDYYWQGATGRFDIMSRASRIDEVIERAPTPRSSSASSACRRSARSRRRELGLPDNASYTRYTDLGRPFVLWNVFAAPRAVARAARSGAFPSRAA